MSVLDVYLQKNEKKRYDVHKKTGISQQLLSNMSKKNVESYSIKTIRAIAETVQKSEGEVVDELLRLEKENVIFEVLNVEDLLLAFENKEPYILIRGEYINDIKSLVKSQLSENELLGLELGSAGTANILAEGFYQLANIFGNKKDEQKKIEKIESKLRLYKIKKNDENNENELLLYLRQLDY